MLTLPRSLLTLTFACTISSCLASDGFTTTAQHITCGKVKFVIESTCKKSRKPMEFNECKPQTLKLADGRAITLPDFATEDASAIKKSGGVLKDLFVTQWGCVRSRGQDLMVLYYSIGGGSAPYAEAWAKYDSSGKLVGKENALDAKAQDELEQSMVDVHSIMPE